MAATSSSNLLANPVRDQRNLNQAAALKFDSNFDLSDKPFSAIFQNISPCKYTDVKSNCLNDNNNALILLHLNIRSLKKTLTISEFITGLTTQPHVICISETKIKNSTGALTNLSIPGYEFVNVNSITNAGGVGVYIAEPFQYEKLTLEPQFDGYEQLWIRIKNTTTSINYVIGTIYQHPFSNTRDFIEFLNDIISELTSLKIYYFILGDININTTISPISREATDYLNMLNSNSVASIIHIPTRVTNTTSSTLDHILTNENRYSLLPLVFDYDITDHYPVMDSW